MLDALRGEVDLLDEELIELIIKRLELARELGRLKRNLGLPIVDKAREGEVVNKWVSKLRSAGLSEDLAYELINAIIRASTYVQVGERLNINVTVVGTGRVGRAVLRALNRVANVSLIQFRDKPARSDVFILATRPTWDSVNYVISNVDVIRGSVLVDLFSVKSTFFNVLEESSIKYGFHYVSAHPLFGDVGEPVNETVVLIPSRSSGDYLDLVRELFSRAGLNVVVLRSPEEHDRLMAYLQAAHHMALLTLYALFRRAGIDLRSAPLTHSLRYTVRAMERVLSQLDVAYEIQSLNPYSSLVREELISTLRSIIELIDRGRLDEVVK
ncbi:MAG: prephenate dehydrogenase/arogenate dehydrogenase family protein [Vulcanisaeta sp.]|nr:prephenate dehydrogenase/arogenate dehydrogenase family protein [Vulcanisaeta sp.]